MNALKQKLSSRKLWAAIVAVVACVASLCLGDALTPEMVDALKCLVTGCACYIFGEAFVDKAREQYGIDVKELIGGLVEIDKKEASAESDAEENKEAAEAEADPTAEK